MINTFNLTFFYFWIRFMDVYYHWAGGTQKGEDCQKKGGNRLFNLILGIEKDKNGDFYIQISINIFKNLLAAANNLTLWTYTYIFYKQPPSKLSARSFLNLSNFCGELDRVKQLLKYTLF